MSFQSCSEAGDEVFYSVSVCTDINCSVGCNSYKMAYPKCDGITGTEVRCSSNVNSYKEYEELTYHYE